MFNKNNNLTFSTAHYAMRGLKRVGGGVKKIRLTCVFCRHIMLSQSLKTLPTAELRTRQQRLFYAQNTIELCREGVEYKTLRGNKIHRLLAVFSLPAPIFIGIDSERSPTGGRYGH